MQEKYGNYTSYIAASYVKHVEGAGARVMPIKWVLRATSIACLLRSTDNAAVPRPYALRVDRNCQEERRTPTWVRGLVKKHPVYRFNEWSFVESFYGSVTKSFKIFFASEVFFFFHAIVTQIQQKLDQKFQYIFILILWLQASAAAWRWRQYEASEMLVPTGRLLLIVTDSQTCVTFNRNIFVSLPCVDRSAAEGTASHSAVITVKTSRARAKAKESDAPSSKSVRP
jgi:hypothetical protein